MRIDAYNQIANAYKLNKPKKADAFAKNAKVNDIVEISDAAKVFQVTRTAVANAPEVREDKIARLKAQMEAGTYSVSGMMIAEKLVEGYFSR